MKVNIYQVDSFTTELFKGNPAGVCITDSCLDETTMLTIAAEMAVSETAFLALDCMQLRWFTPEVEVALCGHGTLAIAHVLREQGLAKTGERLAFQTLSGTLTADLADSHIHLTFPAPNVTLTANINTELVDGLGLTTANIVDYAEFDTKQLIIVNDETIIQQLSPDFSRLATLTGRGVVVSAKSTSSSKPDVDFVSRYFAPWVGVNEDPVTGSAHCALAVYWSQQLNQTCLKGYQASHRGGYVDVELLNAKQVKLSGQAVTVLQGQMTIR